MSFGWHNARTCSLTPKRTRRQHSQHEDSTTNPRPNTVHTKNQEKTNPKTKIPGTLHIILTLGCGRTQNYANDTPPYPSNRGVLYQYTNSATRTTPKENAGTCKDKLHLRTYKPPQYPHPSHLSTRTPPTSFLIAHYASQEKLKSYPQHLAFFLTLPPSSKYSVLQEKVDSHQQTPQTLISLENPLIPSKLTPSSLEIGPTGVPRTATTILTKQKGSRLYYHQHPDRQHCLHQQHKAGCRHRRTLRKKSRRFQQQYTGSLLVRSRLHRSCRHRQGPEVGRPATRQTEATRPTMTDATPRAYSGPEVAMDIKTPAQSLKKLQATKHKEKVNSKRP